MRVLVAASQGTLPASLPLGEKLELPLEGWSYGEIQKAACREALRDHYEALVCVAPGHTLSAAEWESLRTGLAFSPAPSLWLAPTVNRLQAGRSWKRRLYSMAARGLGRILNESKVQDYFLDYTRPWRMYRSDFLRRIPFELNTGERWFDIQLLFQAYALGATVEEASPSVTTPQDHERHFRSRYAWNVLWECVRYRAQKIGFLASMRYRGLLFSETHYQDKSIAPDSTHALAAARVTPNSYVLDLGCGPGHVARALKAKGCTVIGVDREPPSAFEGDRFIAQNLETDPLPEELVRADHVLLLDVLEHLSDPEQFLLRVSQKLNPERRPLFFFSTGNVAFIGVRLALSIGWFNYGERGILDVTHRRLFTVASFRRLLEETGFELLSYRGVGVPWALLFPNRFGRGLTHLSNALARLWPSLWAYQLVIEARPVRRLRLSPVEKPQHAAEGTITDRNHAT